MKPIVFKGSHMHLFKVHTAGAIFLHDGGCDETEAFAVSLLLHAPQKTHQTSVCFTADHHEAPPRSQLTRISSEDFRELLLDISPG
jgi:hypothetical protein